MKKKLISLAICGVLSFADNCFGMQQAYLPQLPPQAQLTGIFRHALNDRNAIHTAATDLLTRADAEIANLRNAPREKFNHRGIRHCVTATAANNVNFVTAFDALITSTNTEGMNGSVNAAELIGSAANARADIGLSESAALLIDGVTHNNGAAVGATATLFDHLMAGTVTANSVASHYDAFATAIGTSHVDTAANFHIKAINNGQTAADRRVADLVTGLNAVNLIKVDSVATVVGADVKDVLMLGMLANFAIAEIGSPDGRNIGGAAPVALGYTPEILANIFGILKALLLP